MSKRIRKQNQFNVNDCLICIQSSAIAIKYQLKYADLFYVGFCFSSFSLIFLFWFNAVDYAIHQLSREL